MHVCSLIKDELEPHMRDFSPSVVNGLYFERLSFGLVPMSVMGVRIVPPTYTGQNVAIGALCPHHLEPSLMSCMWLAGHMLLPGQVQHCNVECLRHLKLLQRVSCPALQKSDACL
jgi:hypothetical protein